jgi:DNA repair photolyase
MAQWNKIKIMLDDGTEAEAQSPIIVSASRSTDVPAFYADWFFDRLKQGYSAWINPFNGVKSYVSYRDTRFIVFWSKNPKPLLKHLNELHELNIDCYIQYSLNDYVDEGLEPNVPGVDMRIKTFQELVQKLGKGHVIWRFDPLVLTDNINIDKLLEKVAYIGDRLKGYTEKMVFSFVDISLYNRVKKNLEKDNVHYIEWTVEGMNDFAKRLSDMNKEHGWNYKLATCAEKIFLERYGIEHNKCIDDELMIRLAFKDRELMKFLHVEVRTIENDIFGTAQIPEHAIIIDDLHYAIKNKDNKDKGQRDFCGCVVSKDIGQYNTCPHQCKYCYANTSRDSALANYKRHRENISSDMIIGG